MMLRLSAIPPLKVVCGLGLLVTGCRLLVAG